MGLASARLTRHRCATQEIDADTARMRALHDAKGQIVREGATYYADRVIHWQVRRSLLGSVDQFDFVANGRVKLAAGPRKFPYHIRPK